MIRLDIIQERGKKPFYRFFICYNLMMNQKNNSNATRTLIPESKEFFDIFLAELALAKKSIYIANYLFEKSIIIDELVNILIDKSKEGVKVILILDTIGSFSAFKKHQEELLVSSGVQVHYFHRIYRFWDINERSHIRLFSIDSNIGYLGGVGFNDDWRKGNIFDHMFRFEEEGAQQIESLFIQLQEYCIHGRINMLPLPKSDEGEILTTTLQSGRILQKFIMDMISRAKETLVIISPYCIPPKKMIRAIERISKKGIKVSIYTNSLKYTDHWYINKASYVVYARLIKRGVSVYTYNTRYMHNKLILIDDMVFGGSVNFDYRSLLINQEVYFLTKKEPIRSTAFQLLETVHMNSSEITLASIKKLSWYQWILNYFFYFFRRIM